MANESVLPPVEETHQAALYTRIKLRIAPFVILLYLVAFLDRVNISFASLSMNRDLGISESLFGLGAGIFFAGYLLFAVPSNLMLVRLGARAWIATIMVVWGALSTWMAFVHGPGVYILFRFLLGAAEAGFFPGIILYLTLWLPASARASLMALFVVSIPLSSVIGAPLSNYILTLGGHGGLRGWQWLFLLEGIPAILLGLLVPLLLAESPRQVTWLTPAEKQTLLHALEHDQPKAAFESVPWQTLLRQPAVLGFAIQYFALMIGLYALGFWVPRLLASRGVVAAHLGWLTAVPFAFGAVGMLTVSRHSDRTGERKGHLVAGFLCIGIAIAAPVVAWPVALAGLSLAAIGIFSAMPIFWAAVTQSVDARLSAVAIAAVNSVGNIGGFAGPLLIGAILQHTGSYTVGLLFTSGSLLAGAILLAVTRIGGGKTTMLDRKAQARQIFHEALRQVDVAAAVARNLRVEDSRLLAAGAVLDLATISDIQIVAIGKAARPMYEAAARVLQSALWPSDRLRGIVVSPRPPQVDYGALTFFPGSHPTPDETSRQAANTILHQLHQATASTLVLFLMSGGSSAMVESPLEPSIPTSDIAAFYRILVGSGLAITDINTLRKHFSAVKGGRLAVAAAPAAQCTLIVSDVPGPPDAVGSGPSLPNSSSRQHCLTLYQRLRATHALPPSIARFFEADTLPETATPTHPAFARAAWTGILSSDDLATAAATAAQASGFHAEIDNTCDEWPADEAAAYLLGRSASLARDHPRTCLISVGEVAVILSGTGGRGGRNQHFALQCALRLAERPSPATVLSAGTDGIDGNSPAAGAIADQHTCSRALLQGIDYLDTLTRFNSFRLFEALGDTIITGPTGNNLRDLRLLLT